MTITVYTKPVCPNCDLLKAKLQRAGIEFEVIDVTKNQAAYNFLVEMGHRSVPVMYQDTKHVKDVDTLIYNNA